MIDVHCHLNFHAYATNYDELIKEAHQKGVTYIINTGTKLDSSEKAVELAHRYDNLYAIVGIHPHHADKQDGESVVISSEVRDPNAHEISHILTIKSGSVRNDKTSWLQQLEKLAKQPKVVGIGEIGLDYYRYQSNGIVNPDLQKEFFEAQLELAHKVNLPLQIHNRHAGKDIVEILEHHKNLLKSDYPGMFHCFAGDMDILKRALDLGFMIGFDGNSTYPGLAPGETVALPDIAKATPLDRMVTETDSPFLTPIPHRGTQNKPSYVIIVGEFLAGLKKISFEKFDNITTENAKRLFHLK